MLLLPAIPPLRAAAVGAACPAGLLACLLSSSNRLGRLAALPGLQPAKRINALLPRVRTLQEAAPRQLQHSKDAEASIVRAAMAEPGEEGAPATVEEYLQLMHTALSSTHARGLPKPVVLEGGGWQGWGDWAGGVHERGLVSTQWGSTGK